MITKHLDFLGDYCETETCHSTEAIYIDEALNPNREGAIVQCQGCHSLGEISLVNGFPFTIWSTNQDVLQRRLMEHLDSLKSVKYDLEGCGEPCEKCGRFKLK